MTRGKRIYVLDTNVLMHDPTALFKFEEHDVYLPMQVIEELDNGKKGTSEASRNARQVSRFLNELVQESGLDNLADGIPLQRPNGLQLRGKQSAGKLRFQTSHFDAGKSFGQVIPDNAILGAILAPEGRNPDLPVVFVSKDINLRIKAAIAASCPRTTRTTVRWTISACSTPAPPNCRKTSGSATATTCAAGATRAVPITKSRRRTARSGIRTSMSTRQARMKSSCASAAWSATARWCCRWSMISATAATPWASAHATASRTSPSTH